MPKYLSITRAEYAGSLSVRLLFNDKHEAVVNVGEWIKKHPHPQYNRFCDEKKFKQFYLDDMGNIAWGKNRDLYFPMEQLYCGKIAD
ncbi:MAG: hypothetical protein KBS42_01395 [Bacteroidales bacterium]|nr:hypothetical protein [Candidatus Colicola coprequi]